MTASGVVLHDSSDAAAAERALLPQPLDNYEEITSRMFTSRPSRPYKGLVETFGPSVT